MFICDVAAVGPAVHAVHVAIHFGLAGLMTMGGSLFLGAGVLSMGRARRAQARAAATSDEGGA